MNAPEVLKDGIHKAASTALNLWQDIGAHSFDSMPTSIPSLRSIARFALGSAQVALLPSNNAVSGFQTASCPNAQLSCHNTTAVSDLCCFNAPGGQLLQTQFWDTNPVAGPTNSWTIHGLW